MSYTPRILTDAEWQDEVREAFGIDSSLLSDSMLSRERVIGQAESEVIENVSTYTTIISGSDVDDKLNLRAAVINIICSILCPTVRNLIPQQERLSEYQYALDKTDWEKKAEEFKKEAYSRIGMISTYSTSSRKIMDVSTPTQVINEAIE